MFIFKLTNNNKVLWHTRKKHIAKKNISTNLNTNTRTLNTKKCPLLRTKSTMLEENNSRHECPEWDFLEIDSDSSEFEVCLCFPDEVKEQWTKK